MWVSKEGHTWVPKERRLKLLLLQKCFEASGYVCHFLQILAGRVFFRNVCLGFPFVVAPTEAVVAPAKVAIVLAVAAAVDTTTTIAAVATLAVATATTAAIVAPAKLPLLCLHLLPGVKEDLHSSLARTSAVDSQEGLLTHGNRQSSGTNISCKGGVDTTINGVDTMAQSKGRNVKKRSTSVDTSPGQVDTTSSQVDTRDLSQGFVLPVWDSAIQEIPKIQKRKILREKEILIRCNKPGHMNGECPENKKEKHKKIHKFKKPKAMVATWSDEDSSEEEEEEKSSSSESEEICFMANSSDGKVDPTVAFLLDSDRRFESFPPLIPSPSVVSHSSLSIIPDSTLHCFNGTQADPSPWSKIKGYGKAHFGG
ncbi:hypothetical protein Taro_007751 [Colocasia esculenta]|uniref:CCHC-type domain-containing protein n=1 Tax=Colocasia esculenta TaxID=4460 RepID=A0A843TW93_COLES|nr:hypothetical protein [Colocasia esculenta]